MKIDEAVGTIMAELLVLRRDTLWLIEGAGPESEVPQPRQSNDHTEGSESECLLLASSWLVIQRSTNEVGEDVPTRRPRERFFPLARCTPPLSVAGAICWLGKSHKNRLFPPSPDGLPLPMRRQFTEH